MREGLFGHTFSTEFTTELQETLDLSEKLEQLIPSGLSHEPQVNPTGFTANSNSHFHHSVSGEAVAHIGFLEQVLYGNDTTNYISDFSINYDDFSYSVAGQTSRNNSRVLGSYSLHSDRHSLESHSFNISNAGYDETWVENSSSSSWGLSLIHI